MAAAGAEVGAAGCGWAGAAGAGAAGAGAVTAGAEVDAGKRFFGSFTAEAASGALAGLVSVLMAWRAWGVDQRG